MNELPDTFAVREELGKLENVLETCLQTLRDCRISKAKLYGPKDVIRMVAGLHGITPAEMCSKGNNRRRVVPRQITHYLMKTVLSMSCPDIARHTGMKDHTTVLYSVKKIRALRAANPEFSRRLSIMEQDLLA